MNINLTGIFTRYKDPKTGNWGDVCIENLPDDEVLKFHNSLDGSGKERLLLKLVDTIKNFKGQSSSLLELFDEDLIAILMDALDRKEKLHTGQLKRMTGRLTWEQDVLTDQVEGCKQASSIIVENSI